MGAPHPLRVGIRKEDSAMSAYLIFTREKTLDAKELAVYWENKG
jgi:hypothetical protein